MSILILAWVLALGLAVSQDAIMSILWYLKHDDEKWHYNHMARLGRLTIGLALIIIASMELAGR